MASAQDVDIETVCQVVQSVQQVVARFYGPQCQQTLLTSQTGQAVITSDGLTILDTLQPSHPVAMLVTTAVKNCLRHTQDGCKVFLLYLAAIVKGLHLHITTGRFCHSGTSKTTDQRVLHQQGCVAVVQCLHRLNQEMMPQMYKQLTAHSCQVYNSLRQTKSDDDILQDVCKTTLAAHYNPHLCDYFSKLLHKFVTELQTCVKAWKSNHTVPVNESHDVICECLRFSLDHFGLLCIKVSNRAYTDCTVLPPLLIRRDFAVKTDHILVKKSVITLLLDSTPEDEDDRPVSYSVQGESSVLDLIHSKRKNADNFVSKCSDTNVDLVMCTETMPGFILDKFRQHNISVIASVLKEDIDLMEQLSGKFSVSLHDDISQDKNLVETEGIQKLGLGGQVYLHVKIKPLVTVNHLVVCAPTVGLCDQAAMALQKALTAMLLCYQGPTNTMCGKPIKSCASQTGGTYGLSDYNLSNINSLKLYSNIDLLECNNLGKKPNSPKLMIIEGGGGFELLLSNLVAKSGKSCGEPNLSAVCDVLSDSLMYAVKVLYDNTSLSDSCRGFLEAKQVLQDKPNEGSLWGLSRRGQPCDMTEKGVLEPVGSKLHVLSCVLRLVEQLLRTDKIVSVKKLEES